VPPPMWQGGSINTTSKLGLPSHTLLKINTARFEKTGRRPEAPQQATHRDNKGARGFGQSRRLWEVFERGRKGRKDLELLIWELALRFEPHNTSCRSPPSHARIGQSRASSSYLSRDLKRLSSSIRSYHARRRCGRQLLKIFSLEAATGIPHHLATSHHWWPVVCNYNCRQANLHDVPASKPTLADMISQPLATSLHWWQDLQLKRPQLTWFSQ